MTKLKDLFERRGFIESKGNGATKTMILLTSSWQKSYFFNGLQEADVKDTELVSRGSCNRTSERRKENDGRKEGKSEDILKERE